MNDDAPPRNRTWLDKFAGAFHGVAVGVRGQTSFAVHGTFVVLVISAAGLCHVSLTEWCLLLLCMTLVLTSEMFNSALETLAKAIDRQHNPYLADGLDMASGAVLLASLGASIVGSIIFLNRAIAMLVGS